MLNAIITSYPEVYDLLLEKQRSVNDYKLKKGKQPNNDILDLITTLNRLELIEICNFLQPFKVLSNLFTQNIFIFFNFKKKQCSVSYNL